jgi:pyrroloquinoline-quinone synthase
MTRTETTLETMRAVIRSYDLLGHPFYQAWSAGTLPVEALAKYAREYGAFIGVLDRGWQTLGEPEGAKVERHHLELWNGFARALDTAVVDAPAVAAVQALVDEATRSFATPAEAAGALYAFEVQQPATARSKLEGLGLHYASLSSEVRPYFQAHACETGEDTLIEEKLARMTEAEQERAAAACERMSKALWDALTGIHEMAC